MGGSGVRRACSTLRPRQILSALLSAPGRGNWGKKQRPVRRDSILPEGFRATLIVLDEITIVQLMRQVSGRKDVIQKKVRRAAKSALREFRPKPGQETPLTNMQEAFIAWNAERLSMTPSDARDRLLTSMAPFDGGHKGKEFRQFCGLAHNVFLPFFSDQEDEIFESYNFHGPLHFLRNACLQ